MSNTTDRMLDRYVELKLKTLRTGESGTVTVTTKLIEDGVELEAWIGNECIGATYTSYAHMGVGVTFLRNPVQIDAKVFDNE